MSLKVKSINGSDFEPYFLHCVVCFSTWRESLAHLGACCDSQSLGLHQESSICINIISVNRRSAPSIQPLNRFIFPKIHVFVIPNCNPISRYFVFFQLVQDKCSFAWGKGGNTKRQIDRTVTLCEAFFLF